MNMINSAAANYTPNNIIATPFEWGAVSYNWQGGIQAAGGLVPTTALLNAGQVSAGFEVNASNVVAGFPPFPAWSLGGQGSATPVKMRIYYDAIAITSPSGGFFMEV
jgi:hypothetical protein